MTPAPCRFGFYGALAWLAASGGWLAAAAQTPVPTAPVRATPTRPGIVLALAAPVPVTPMPWTVTRIGEIQYVNVADAAKQLGLHLAWTERSKQIALTGEANRAIIDADSRDATINGLRVFLGDPARTRAGQFFLSLVDVEHCLIPRMRPGYGATVPPPPKIIAIDPGHGGRDEGAENRAVRIKEKNLTFDVAQRLKKLLEAAGYKVVLTRNDDHELADRKEVDLALRADVANRAGADLFISIHFNAAVKDTRGTEVFSFAPRLQRSTDSWGANEDDRLMGDEPVNRFDRWSVVLAAALHREQLHTLKTDDRGSKLAHWAVLRPLKCPGVLVEPAIITNDREAKRVATPAFRQQIAEALAAGVRDYAATLAALRPKPVTTALAAGK